MLTVGSLFSGIGGFDLGLERAGMKVIWQSEIDPYASAVLKKHWSHVPNHGDIRTITADRVERPDVLCGGFPCQPFSSAGNRDGAEDDRHLWPQMCRVVEVLRPDWVVGENVAGIISMELDAVLSDLASLGYSATPIVIPAVAVDAPHRRDRVWIIARDSDSDSDSESACAVHAETQGLSRAVADADSRCEPRRERTGKRRVPIADGGGQGVAAHEGRPANDAMCGRHWRADDRVCTGRHRIERPSRWPTESGIRRVVDGLPNRTHRLRCLGNAIVPQIAEIIGRAISAIEDEQ